VICGYNICLFGIGLGIYVGLGIGFRLGGAQMHADVRYFSNDKNPPSTKLLENFTNIKLKELQPGDQNNSDPSFLEGKPQILK